MSSDSLQRQSTSAVAIDRAVAVDRDGAVDLDGVVALTRALVRLPTVARPGAAVVEQPAADLLTALMREFGWQVVVQQIAPGRPNVVGIVEGHSAGRTLLFEGHSDVVTEGDRSLWSFDPFGAELVDGRIRGRGAADMKSGVAAMIYAARAVQLTGFAGRLLVAALVDEEGMMTGVKRFVAELLPRIAPTGVQGAIVCEPEAGEVCPSSKGAIRLLIEFTGLMAHGAMPEHGRNPLPALGEMLQELARVQRQLIDRFGEHPHLGLPYLTPTAVQAGSAEQMNVIPAKAKVYVDIRTVPGVDHLVLLADIETLATAVADRSGLTVRLEVIDDRPPVDTSPDAPIVRALTAAHRSVTGTAPVLGGVPGTTDGTILTRDAGLDTVVYGPGGKWIAHQVDEYVEVDDLLICTEVYARAALNFFAAPATPALEAAVTATPAPAEPA